MNIQKLNTAVIQKYLACQPVDSYVILYTTEVKQSKEMLLQYINSILVATGLQADYEVKTGMALFNKRDALMSVGVLYRTGMTVKAVSSDISVSVQGILTDIEKSAGSAMFVTTGRATPQTLRNALSLAGMSSAKTKNLYMDTVRVWGITPSCLYATYVSCEV